ncbi:MAG: hypothetical protein ACF8PN_08150 [Phycisphaerales bacterium]
MTAVIAALTGVLVVLILLVVIVNPDIGAAYLQAENAGLLALLGMLALLVRASMQDTSADNEAVREERLRLLAVQVDDLERRLERLSTIAAGLERMERHRSGRQAPTGERLFTRPTDPDG